jgi:hypothetical protein
MLRIINSEAKDIKEAFRKRPWIQTLFTIVTLGAIAMVAFALLCNQYYHCSKLEVDFTLSIGLILCCSIVFFVILPCLVIMTLNCLFVEPYDDPPTIVVKRRPPPPRGPPPISALKSFRETFR